MLWVHGKLSGMQVSFCSIKHIKCKRYEGKVRQLDGRPVKSVAVDSDSLEVVNMLLLEGCYQCWQRSEGKFLGKG